ncbi:sce7725 family protein [Shewanella salipaludis]|uniref:Sce7725 family protein n=1 Tax=Shewanella salipaludis TaxID=2723052 RepID=A0A972JJL0_9GAMM|nr:sce7725 family protein [Shewanella salipaludis]NMH66233.1 sce7725 family protein [Shewanella salipaludis]
MYYPYFRGKQYELIVVKENAKLISNSGFIPIIEPVKSATSGLVRTLDAIKNENGKVILIINPVNGDFKNNHEEILLFFKDNHSDFPGLSPGVLLTDDIDLEAIKALVDRSSANKVALIHSGYSNVRDIVSLISNNQNVEFTNIFIEQYCGRLYRNHFSNGGRVLIRDGFIKRSANRLHPDSEFFSDLHVTYGAEEVNAFGDFLIVGDEYSESGGPAYSVAIHVTYVDATNDEAMYLFHFKSDRNDTPADPAGKFLEALAKLVSKLELENSVIAETDAMKEFRQLYDSEHFPGLGYLKKMMMQHHIELMASLVE